MTKVTIENAEHHLRELVDRAANGDEVLITDPADAPLAKLVSARGPRAKRVAGLAKGRIWMSDDFDEPLEDFQELAF
jgi:antitoxin (DNA-binding transcriptional repressor) of toxin-antitoxin stability system